MTLPTLWRNRVRVQNKSVEQVINETLRLGMTIAAKPADTQEFRVRPNRSGFVEGIDPTS